MPWFKVDDQFWSHPKVVELTPDAVALWVRSGSYAAQHLTDGRITTGALRMLGGVREVADELVLAGLWEQVDSRTWTFRDWFDYQPTAEEVADRRAKRSAAGRKGAEARWDGKSHGKSQAGAMANGSQTDAPSPSRPRTPTTKTSKSQSSSRRASVSTDSVEISEMTQRAAGQLGVQLPGIISAIAQRCGIDVDAYGALQVSRWLLDKAKDAPKAPQRYVLKCIDDSTAEVQQYLHEQGIAS